MSKECMEIFYKWHNLENMGEIPVSHSVQFSSVVQSCPTLCNPMDCSVSGFPVHHQLLEFTQTHVHWVHDAIQPAHPLSSPSPPASSLSQHKGFFQWVSSSHQVAKVLEFQLQHQSFQWIFRTDLGLTGLIFLQSKGLSRIFCNNTVQKHRSLALSFLYGPTLTSIHDYWNISHYQIPKLNTHKESGWKHPEKGICCILLWWSGNSCH